MGKIVIVFTFLKVWNPNSRRRFVAVSSLPRRKVCLNLKVLCYSAAFRLANIPSPIPCQMCRPDHRLLNFDLRASSYISNEEEMQVEHSEDYRDILIFRLGGSLLYPAMASTKETILQLQRAHNCRSIVIDFTCCTRMDYTGCQVRTN